MLKFSSVVALLPEIFDGFKKRFFFWLPVFFLLLEWEWYSLASFYTLSRILFYVNSILSFKEIKMRKIIFLIFIVFTQYRHLFPFEVLTGIISVQPEELLFLNLLATKFCRILDIWKWLYFGFILWKIFHQIQSSMLTVFVFQTIWDTVLLSSGLNDYYFFFSFFTGSHLSIPLMFLCM